MPLPENQAVVVNPDPPPVKPGGNDDNPRMYTKEEVEAKLRGKGSEADRSAARAEAAEAKLADIKAASKKQADAALASQGKFEELFKAEQAKTAALEKEHGKLAKAEEDRVTAISKLNDDRVKAFSKEDQELVPSGIKPDDLSIWLTKMEARMGGGTTEQGSGIFQGGPKSRAKQGAANSIEDANAELAEMQVNPFAQRKPADKGAR